MKYEIDTIPVWDALKAQTECPLCLLEKRSRMAAVRYFLGPSVMVPEVRVTVNETGFCPENLRLLAKDPNKLGLALLGHTRLKALRAKIAKKSQPARAAAEKASSGPVAGLSTHGPLKEKLSALAGFLRDEEASCLIEAKVTEDRQRYAFTLVHLWAKDQDFRRTWASGRGTCLHHAPDLLLMAAETLGSHDLGPFAAEYLELLDANLSRVEQDVLAFTQTFDSTGSHAIAGRPEGALDRCLQKLAGTFPEYEDESRARKGPLMGGVSGG